MLQTTIKKFISVYFGNLLYKFLPKIVIHLIKIKKTQKPLIKNFRKVKLGFYGNIGNNHYTTVKTLTKHGFNAELVVSDYFDSYNFNNPVSDNELFEWKNFKRKRKRKLKNVVFTYQRQNLSNFIHYFSFLSSIKKEYEKFFSCKIGLFKTILLSSQWSHWDTIKTFKNYDILIFSSGAILLSLFHNKTTVIFPSGSDLSIDPFEKTFIGKLYKLAFLSSNLITIANKNPSHHQINNLKKLGIKKYIFSTILYNPEDYKKKKLIIIRIKVLLFFHNVI